MPSTSALIYEGFPTPPTPVERAALRRERADGVTLLVVTDSMASDARALLRDWGGPFDVVVAEGGGVVMMGRRVQALASEPDAGLVAALRRQGIGVRTGRVIVRCARGDLGRVANCVGRLRAPYTLRPTAQEVLLLPVDVSRSGATRVALGWSGVSADRARTVPQAVGLRGLEESLGVASSPKVATGSEEARSAAPDLDSIGPLTQRERQTLGLVASGQRNDEIAKQLHLSLNTVKSYIRTAYRKIGVDRRALAVAWVHERGVADALLSDARSAPGYPMELAVS